MRSPLMQRAMTERRPRLEIILVLISSDFALAASSNSARRCLWVQAYARENMIAVFCKQKSLRSLALMSVWYGDRTLVGFWDVIQPNLRRILVLDLAVFEDREDELHAVEHAMQIRVAVPVAG